MPRSIFYGIRRDISYLGGSLVYLTPELLNWLKFVTSSSLRNQLLTRFFSTRRQKIWITHWISLRLFLPSLILKLRVLSNQIELKSPVASLLVIIKVITRQKYFYSSSKQCFLIRSRRCWLERACFYSSNGLSKAEIFARAEIRNYEWERRREETLEGFVIRRWRLWEDFSFEDVYWKTIRRGQLNEWFILILFIKGLSPQELAENKIFRQFFVNGPTL